MNTSTQGLRAVRAPAVVCAIAILSTLLLVALPQPAAAAIDCWSMAATSSPNPCSACCKGWT
jgi:hypothetical protein